MLTTCYLCGKPLGDAELSDDHRVPMHLLKRDQPKVRGFDYAGKETTHRICNNHFRSEIYCAKALKMLALLHNKDCVYKVQNATDPSIVMLAVNAEYFKDFTRRDLKFFKFIDLRDKQIKEFSSPSFFSDKSRTNPIQDALRVALAVLVKSAAALLIDRHLQDVPKRWRVFAMPYTGATSALDFDFLIGKTQPFDIGVKAWVKQLESGDFLVIYRANEVIVFFVFQFSERHSLMRTIRSHFADTNCLLFNGDRLIDLLDYQWQRV